MSPFTKDDFLKPEIGQRLSVIIMSKMNRNVLTPFSRLIAKEKKQFNHLLNAYIASLGEEWEETITKDFNDICHLDLFDPDCYFNPEKLQVMSGDPELILTEEQKQFQEDMKDPVKKALWEEKLKQEIIEAEKKALEEGRVHIIPPPPESEPKSEPE